MRFHVKGLKADGAVLTLTVDAADAAQAEMHAVGAGVRVFSVRAEAGWSWALRGAGKFPLLLFSRELLVLLQAGISLTEALETLAEKEARPDTKRVLLEIVARLREGLPLSAAMEQSPAAFPPLFCATVKASERTGGLVEALARYIAYESQLETVRKKVSSAAIYPALLLGVGSLVLAFLVLYVVPRFSKIYTDLGENLPWLSRVLARWGEIVDGHIGAGLFVLAAAAAFAWYAFRRADKQRLVTAVLSRTPALRERMRIYELARLYRTLGTLLGGGMAIVPAIGMVSGILRPAMRVQLQSALVLIREGRTISEAMERFGLVTPVALRMLRVGERTGRMGEMMEQAADFHDEETARWVDWFSRLFEPILMAAIGVVVGAVVILMYMPIFELAGNIQ